MSGIEAKKSVAEKALPYIQPNEILGLGTGSTVDCLINLLPPLASTIKGVVSSSNRTTEQIEALGIPLVDPKTVSSINLYIDGADEINPSLEMIKGGGGALTREKIVAALSQTFICIADNSKWVKTLGAFPLPIEIIPMSITYVTKELKKLGGTPVLRQENDSTPFITDNGNYIIDVKNLEIKNPLHLEAALNQITGVVTNGLFAKRKADILLLGHTSKVEVLTL